MAEEKCISFSDPFDIRNLVRGVGGQRGEGEEGTAREASAAWNILRGSLSAREKILSSSGGVEVIGVI